MLGDMSVGKSCIAYQFVHGTFNGVAEPTIGAAFCSRCIQVKNVVCKFQIWDTAGMEKYKSLMPMYYRGSSAAIVVYDITKETTFESMKTWICELKAHADPDIFICIIGNKCDLESHREVRNEDAMKFASTNNLLYFETSALTGYNITEVFQEIANRLSVLQRWEETAEYSLQSCKMSEIYDTKKLKKSDKGRRKFCNLA